MLFDVIDKLATLRMRKFVMIFVQNNKIRDNEIFIAGLDKMFDADEEVWS